MSPEYMRKGMRKNAFQTFIKTVGTVLNRGSDWLEHWGSRRVHNIMMTGLSRSGKSMLFTSLMALLMERHRASINLPLLKALPLDLVEDVTLNPIPYEAVFPLEQSLDALENGHWPPPTEAIYGFELVLTLRASFWVKRALGRKRQVVFRFYDYPGEWLTDLPMLEKPFVAWSDSSWAQQSNRPQRFFAQQWQAFTDVFDFDQMPNDDVVEGYISAYRDYLQKAKAGGITLLQPGALLLPDSDFDWQRHGFAPLPTSICSDPAHPWTQRFTQGYQVFQTRWLKPLREAYFLKADKQVVLVDVLEGLSHGRAHLNQLKETVSHLSSVLVKGRSKWYKPGVLSRSEFSRVAFVATKVDLVPASQHGALLKLLQEITSGARAQLSEQQVDFQHFLASALQVTDPGEISEALRYTNRSGDYTEAVFEPLPETMSELGEHENYPYLKAGVPKDWWKRMQHSQGVDRLFEYLLGVS